MATGRRWGQPPALPPAPGILGGVAPPRDDAAGSRSVSGTAYAEAALELVELVPPGHATTYGDVAEALRDAGWGGGPRSVGAVMARYGSGVPWWRVVRADGGLPPCDPAAALQRHRAEGTPLTPGGRVDLSRARAALAVAQPPP